MIKIVYVVGGLVTINGMSTILSAKINYLAGTSKFEVYMILTEKSNHPWCYNISPKVKWINLGINFDELDTMPLYKKIMFYYIKQKKYKRLFTNYLMKIQPDITVSALRREINFINEIHDGSKKIGELHFEKSFYRNFNFPYLPSFVNNFITMKWRNSLIKHIRNLDKFVVLTHEDYNNWPEIDNKIIIPNFIPEYSGTTSTLNSKSIIAVGRFTWQKGFDLLIKAWKDVSISHPDWTLNIYGSGERSYYQGIINSLGLSKQITCHAPTSNIYEKYKENSCFVLSSRYEGFGIVIVEAMSVGLPVVAFACPCGPSDIISNNTDGILVEKNNIEKLSKAICYMIEHPKQRKEMGKNAIEKAKSYYPDQIMKQWIRLFESI